MRDHIKLSPTVSWQARPSRRSRARAVWTAEELERRYLLSGLTIVPTFGSSIQNDPNSATIEATLNTAVQQYAENFSDPITVHITFTESASGLGSSSAEVMNVSYAAYRAALISHATTADDATAIANLPTGTTSPVNGDNQVQINLPNARALGFSAATSMDGTVNLNTSICNLSRTNINSSKYDLQSVAEHEIDEILGIGSELTGLSNSAPTPGGPVTVEDLFRYDQNGNRSYTTDESSEAFFSLDGTTDLARFNQDASGDFNDWYSTGPHTPQVQDAFATPGTTPDLGVELEVLDALGFTRVIPHQAPVAANDSTTLNENSSVLINELSNDTASGGATIDPTTVQTVTAAGHGTTHINPSTGQITYTPAAGYSGPDSFTYTVNDSTGATSNVATVSVSVHGNPVANNDAATTNENSAVQINELSNDTTSDGATLVVGSVSLATGPTHGTAAIDPTTGDITYTPAAGYSGVDSFAYNVTDSLGAASNTATISITVHPNPVATNTSATTNENSPVLIDELAGDSASGSATIDPTTVLIGTAPAHGTASVDPVTGQITYTPTSGYFGGDSLTYTVNDTLSATSNAATISIVVHADPVASSDAATTNENTAVLINELTNDTASGGATLDPTTVQIAAAPSNGTTSIDAMTGEITYTPATGYVGSDTFSYTVTDSDGAVSNAGVITVTIKSPPVHNPPIANNDNATTTENTPVVIDELANDTSSSGAPLDRTTVQIAAAPAHGTATFNPSTGKITYTPASDYFGPDSFTYTVDDTEGAISSPATVSINVTQSKTGSTSPVYPIVLHGKALHGIEGSSITNAIIGTFTNHNGTGADNFQASIDFGDGTFESGTVSGTNGHYTVTAPSHTYATLGKYTTQLTVTDTAGAAAQATFKSSITGAKLRGVAANTSAGLNVESDLVLGTVGDADPAGLLPLESGVVFTGVINWGDGAHSAATLTQDPTTHIFTVSGSHQYVRFGGFHARTVFHEAGGKSVTLVSIVLVS